MSELVNLRSKEQVRAWKEFQKLSDNELKKLYDQYEKAIIYYENADSFVQSASEQDTLYWYIKRLDNLKDYVLTCRPELKIHIV